MRAAVVAKRQTPSDAWAGSACINFFRSDWHARMPAACRGRRPRLLEYCHEITIGAMRSARWCHAWREMASPTQNGHAGLEPS